MTDCLSFLPSLCFRRCISNCKCCTEWRDFVQPPCPRSAPSALTWGLPAWSLFKEARETCTAGYDWTLVKKMSSLPSGNLVSSVVLYNTFHFHCYVVFLCCAYVFVFRIFKHITVQCFGWILHIHHVKLVFIYISAILWHDDVFDHWRHIEHIHMQKNRRNKILWTLNLQNWIRFDPWLQPCTSTAPHWLLHCKQSWNLHAW